jgi:hypothetical protein
MDTSNQTAISIIKMPWEDRSPGCKDVVWRYSGNPIIPRDLILRPTASSTARLSHFKRAFYDPPSGGIALYYGDADTVTALAFTYLDEGIEFIKSNP